MNLSPATLVVGLMVSTIGFSLFLYGKRQARVPQAVAGIALMLLPLAVTNAWWLGAASVASLVGMQISLRAGH